MSLGIVNTTTQGALDISAKPLFELGTIWQPKGDKGPTYAYAKAGGTNLAAGVYNTSAAVDANFTAIAVAVAAAVGDKVIYVTAGAACADGEYEQGNVIVYDDAGVGYAYKIKRHETMAASGTMTVELEDPIQIALKTSSVVTLRRNPYMATIVAATTITGPVVGVCPTVVTANYYYWLLVRADLASVLIQGTPAVGNALSPSSSVAGAAAINSGTLPIIGTAVQVGVNGKYCAVKFNLL